MQKLFENWRKYLTEASDSKAKDLSKEEKNILVNAGFNYEGIGHRMSAGKPWITYELDDSTGVWNYRAHIPNGDIVDSSNEELTDFLERVGNTYQLKLDLFENWRKYEKSVLKEQKILLTEKKLEGIFLIEDQNMLYEEFEKLLLEDAELLAEGLFAMAANMYERAKEWTSEKIARAIQKMLGVLEKLSEKFDNLMVNICNVVSKTQHQIAQARGQAIPGGDQCDPETAEKLKYFGHGFRGALNALQRHGGQRGRNTRHFILIAGGLTTVATTMWMNKNLDPEMIELATNFTRDAAEIFNSTDPESAGKMAGEFVNNVDEWADKAGYASASVMGAKGTKGVATAARFGAGSIPIEPWRGD